MIDIRHMDFQSNPLVKRFGEERIWINWQREKVIDEATGLQKTNADGSLKFTKIPKRSSSLGSYNASVSDPSSWSTFAEASAVKDLYSGIGIVFSRDDLNLVGVDLDHYVKPAEHQYVKGGSIDNDAVLDFIIRANTYIELSPSGTGLHAFFITDKPFVPAQNKVVDGDKPLEVYSSRKTDGTPAGRYFTFTGSIFKGGDNDVRHISTEELEELLTILGYTKSAPHPAPPQIVVETTESNATTALKYISPFDNDQNLIKAMFASANGKEIKEIYNGDASRFNGDMSSADMSLCGALAFWTGKDKERMRRIWLSSVLGGREKTQTRKDYQDMTLDEAINSCKNVYRPDFTEQKEKWIMGGGKKNPRPEITGAGGATNIARLLSTDPKYMGRIRRNTFSHQVETFQNGKWSNMQDDFIRGIMVYVSDPYPFFSQVSEKTVIDGVLATADTHPVNPPLEWIKSLVWDKQPRLDSWLYFTYGANDGELNHSIGSNFIKQMVKRILEPGCQADYVLCLIGAQGLKKSSSLRILGGEWHVENTGNLEDKDFVIIMAQNILVEFSEGDVMRRSDARVVKAMVTKISDQIRLPYDKGITTIKRGNVFALTTNDEEFLRDDSGGRRYLPVFLTRMADTEWLAANREQLFAEAKERLLAGETAYEFPKDDLYDIQAISTVKGAYDDKIVEFWKNLSPAKKKGVKVLDAYEDVFQDKERPREMSNQTENKIISVFKRQLFLKPGAYRNEKGVSAWGWKPTDKTKQYFDLEIEPELETEGGELAAYFEKKRPERGTTTEEASMEVMAAMEAGIAQQEPIEPNEEDLAELAGRLLEGGEG